MASLKLNQVRLFATTFACIACMTRASGQRARHVWAATATGPRAAVLQLVGEFEAAYKAKDKKTMIFKLMAPTHDAEALEKRFQWYRGYGPHDMPGTRHPPILFESSKGSFIPAQYKVVSASSGAPDQWTVVVKEQGSYHDEDGKWAVTRLRRFKVTRIKAGWYVSDYILQENPEDYGFWVDDIVDKMTKVGK